MSNDDQELSRLYQQQAIEQPSAQLDQKILAQANEQLEHRKLAKKFTNRMQYSIVASMAMVGLLFFSFPEYYQMSEPQLPADLAPLADSMPPTEIERSTIQSSAPLPAQLQMSSDQLELAPLDTNTINAMKKKTSLSKATLQILTADQQQQLMVIDKLLETDRPQAIKLLKKLQLQYPDLVLATKYQSLLKQ